MIHKYQKMNDENTSLYRKYICILDTISVKLLCIILSRCLSQMLTSKQKTDETICLAESCVQIEILRQPSACFLSCIIDKNSPAIQIPTQSVSNGRRKSMMISTSPVSSLQSTSSIHCITLPMSGLKTNICRLTTRKYFSNPDIIRMIIPLLQTTNLSLCEIYCHFLLLLLKYYLSKF